MAIMKTAPAHRGEISSCAPAPGIYPGSGSGSENGDQDRERQKKRRSPCLGLFILYKKTIKISMKSEKYSMSKLPDIGYTVHVNENIVR